MGTGRQRDRASLEVGFNPLLYNLNISLLQSTMLLKNGHQYMLTRCLRVHASTPLGSHALQSVENFLNVLIHIYLSLPNTT